MQLRGTLNQDWVQVLPSVINALNATPLKKLGWHQPISINSEIDSVNVDNAKNHHKIETYSEPNVLTQQKNQEEYRKSSDSLQINDFVYLDVDEKLFDKSFDVSVFC